jgi:hypothetical protein
MFKTPRPMGFKYFPKYFNEDVFREKNRPYSFKKIGQKKYPRSAKSLRGYLILMGLVILLIYILI